MASFTERRRTMRIAVHGNLNVESVPAGQSLRLVDIGMGGFCVRSLAELPPHLVMSYRFTTPDRKWSAIFRARTVYSKPLTVEGETGQHYVSGLTFVNTESPKAQRELMAMMDYAMNFVSFS